MAGAKLIVALPATPGAVARLRHWARTIRRDAHALRLAARDRRTPWPARLLALLVAAYGLSPIDLIPDVIPVLGLLDEALLLPLAMLPVRLMLPPALPAEHRATAEAAATRPVSRGAAVAVIGLWLGGALLLGRWLWPGAAE